MTSINDYQIQTDDIYRPLVSKPSLQQYDNYQIYSIAAVEQGYSTVTRGRTAPQQTSDEGRYTQALITYYSAHTYYYLPKIQVSVTERSDGSSVALNGFSSLFYSSGYLAFQRYSPQGIPIDFTNLIAPMVKGLKDNYVYTTWAIFDISQWRAESTSKEPFSQRAVDEIAECNLLNSIDRTQFSFVEIQFDSQSSQNSYRGKKVFTRRQIIYYVYGSVQVTPPSFLDLLDGYSLDPRKSIKKRPTVTLSKSGKAKISYYSVNNLEPNPLIRSIDWRVYEIEIVKGRAITLPIERCVIGTLLLESSLGAEIKSALLALNFPSNSYNWDDYYYDPSRTNAIFSEWVSAFDSQQMPSSPAPSLDRTVFVDYTEYSPPVFRQLSANNNVWDNDSTVRDDINFDIDSDLCRVDEEKSFKQYIKLQDDGSYGDLTMDSPRIIEIHAALDAQKYSQNELDSEKPRITNLGFLIDNVAKILGLRFDANGTIDRDKEKVYTRKILKNPTYDKRAFSTNCFGLHGRLTPHLSNSNGEDMYDVVYDIPQMLEACFEHLNRSLGVQQGTEIKVANPITGKEDYYPSQLSMMLDMHSKITETYQNQKETYNLAFAIAQSQREMYSGIGIPVTYKSLFTRYGEIPYLGHQVSKGSINTSLTTVKVNLGILLGAQMVSAPNKKSAINKWLMKRDK